jgi:peptidoglycan/LPS O-acetylase OafA/YrhL
VGPRPAGSRIPSLDGLRGALVPLILWSHLLGTRGFLGRGIEPVLGDVGYLAVRTFFVISGFLITTLLIAEIDAGGIDLRAFYLRRFLRIFPAFYAYVAIMAVAAAAGLVVVPARHLAAAAGYVVNYVHDRAWPVGHLWSLSVEEHFYLIWPISLSLLRGATPAIGRRRAVWALCAVIAAGPILRIGTLSLFPGEEALIGQTTHTVADAIAFGCLLAFVRDRLWADPRYVRFLGSPFFVVVPVAALLLNRSFPHIRFFFAVGDTLTSLCVTLIVDRVVRFPSGRTGRLLNSAPLVFVGVRSYSLYLWQQPFLDRYDGGAARTFPLSLALALTCGLVSYQLVERPLMRLRARVRARAPG